MYKIRKQTISVGLCFALALSSLAMPFSIQSSAKEKLRKTKFSMTVGQKKKIVITGKKKKATYSFSSSSKEKASVFVRRSFFFGCLTRIDLFELIDIKDL